MIRPHPPVVVLPDPAALVLHGVVGGGGGIRLSSCFSRVLGGHLYQFKAEGLPHSRFQKNSCIFQGKNRCEQRADLENQRVYTILYIPAMGRVRPCEMAGFAYRLSGTSDNVCPVNECVDLLKLPSPAFTVITQYGGQSCTCCGVDREESSLG